MNSYFRFKQFTVRQENCAMKVGTDGVLLGAWVPCRDTARILDIGTGTGLLALMLAQRSQASIDAVEIDPLAARQATENAVASPFAGRIKVHCIAFQDFSPDMYYDLIVSNPPYFRNSLKSPKNERNAARHDDSLPLSALLAGVKYLLAPAGKLAVILPCDEGQNFVRMAAENGLYCHEKTAVVPRPNADAKRLLLHFGYDKKEYRNTELLIETEHRHCYSAQFRELTKDFYLKH